ncbi:MAG: hypothetical protein A3A98_01870 [Candidatus Staskawiczbacteria bacterium RIFCSPLOWO2_01_FULL_40_39]|uniref:Signal transduction histidine kinase dimerisation/phosphoacceptor domain-containing protein n=1 Tax=Candidatus Staskawiczbacteria bacterium RIFCSPHIGHO2_01_FULL_39_25 TaxID=1802202 RepID=A0A1G2HR56_9BACT|nr:MAG: hypothetical protein A2730_02025 [Candidatus Staskawiczbacteria bacterium RIFCSPHIGHO2_01_FULL_39_25]OGZ72718.1 MAG: hypothetical protein A3A98_01870 [Candidatus Staskawiczbacteria bacterium RIFCSPLOWO2_01_FULL_40_39]OGZ76599.1 MAG: hypothetical protein A3I87_02975 [Candidatus Staskawiczbacteria bacterium RIFCSPLOWO2_02_FULL_39_8]
MKTNKKKKIKPSETIHKLNNLLTSVMLSAELLVRQGYGQKKKYLKIILSESKKIKNLLKKLSKN